MSNYRAALRYAEAILSVANEMKCLEAVSSDFNMIERLIHENRDFMLFLRSPIINREKKRNLLTTVLGDKVCDVTMKFILLLTAKEREGLLPEIIEEYDRLRDQLLGIINVTARTVVAMTPEQEKRLADQFGKSAKKQVRLKKLIDPSLKGGFIVQHEDTVWDASVRHQLELLRRQFLGENA